MTTASSAAIPAKAAMPGRKPDTPIRIPAAISRAPPTRWVLYQTVSFASVQGRRMPKV